MCAISSLPMSQWGLPTHNDTFQPQPSLNMSFLMARIPSKPPLFLAFARPLQFTYHFHDSRGRLRALMLPLETLRPQTKAVHAQGLPAGRHWSSTVVQALTSLAWPPVLLFWRHHPFSPVIPDRGFKTPSHLPSQTPMPLLVALYCPCVKI